MIVKTNMLALSEPVKKISTIVNDSNELVISISNGSILFFAGTKFGSEWIFSKTQCQNDTNGIINIVDGKKFIGLVKTLKNEVTMNFLNDTLTIRSGRRSIKFQSAMSNSINARRTNLKEIFHRRTEVDSKILMKLMTRSRSFVVTDSKDKELFWGNARIRTIDDRIKVDTAQDRSTLSRFHTMAKVGENFDATITGNSYMRIFNTFKDSEGTIGITNCEQPGWLCFSDPNTHLFSVHSAQEFPNSDKVWDSIIKSIPGFLEVNTASLLESLRIISSLKDETMSYVPVRLIANEHLLSLSVNRDLFTDSIDVINSNIKFDCSYPVDDLKSAVESIMTKNVRLFFAEKLPSMPIIIASQAGNFSIAVSKIAEANDA